MSAAKVDVRDPWFVYAPASHKRLLEAATDWRNEAARGGTAQHQKMCLSTACELETKAAALTSIGGAA